MSEEIINFSMEFYRLKERISLYLWDKGLMDFACEVEEVTNSEELATCIKYQLHKRYISWQQAIMVEQFIEKIGGKLLVHYLTGKTYRRVEWMDSIYVNSYILLDEMFKNQPYQKCA